MLDDVGRSKSGKVDAPVQGGFVQLDMLGIIGIQCCSFPLMLTFVN